MKGGRLRELFHALQERLKMFIVLPDKSAASEVRVDRELLEGRKSCACGGLCHPGCSSG